MEDENYDFSRQDYEFKKTAGHVPGGTCSSAWHKQTVSV